MTFISRGEVYDGPPTDCDLDALIDVREQIKRHRSSWPATSIAPLFMDAFTAGLASVLPAAAGLGGAGFPVPVSGPAPGTPNEMRNE